MKSVDGQGVLELEPEPAVAAPTERLCEGCDGTGKIAPDAFGDCEPWHKYQAKAVALWLQGYPIEGSAIAMGMIHATACTMCGGKGVAR